MATQDNVFDDFKRHYYGFPTETQIIILNLIREHYPEHHVTAVDTEQASLIDFANADKAEATLKKSFDATRNWSPAVNKPDITTRDPSYSPMIK